MNGLQAFNVSYAEKNYFFLPWDSLRLIKLFGKNHLTNIFATIQGYFSNWTLELILNSVTRV